jgi:hypothetical protein
MSNYILPENDAIQYEMKKTENGWILCVKLPPATSASDQVLVLDWIQSYRRTVKENHPHWLTAFRETDSGYKLLIERADNVHEMLSAVGLMRSGDRVRDYWSKSLEYAG